MTDYHQQDVALLGGHWERQMHDAITAWNAVAARLGTRIQSPPGNHLLTIRQRIEALDQEMKQPPAYIKPPEVWGRLDKGLETQIQVLDDILRSPNPIAWLERLIEEDSASHAHAFASSPDASEHEQ